MWSLLFVVAEKRYPAPGRDASGMSLEYLTKRNQPPGRQERQGRKSLKSLFLARLAVQNHIHFVRDSK
jgi:hypothetical protein